MKALQSFEIDLVKTREALEQKIGIGQASQPEGITPNCKSAIVLAVDEARRMKHSFVGSGHILLGVMRVKEDMAAQFLEEMNMETDRTRVKVWELFRHPDPGKETPG
jgi:ATP-dependent Clp protease ATP-binding subunit ClpC